MSKAFVLSKCEPGFEETSVSKLKQIDLAKKVQGVFGAYDIVVELETNGQKSIKDIITRKIRGLDNIYSTLILQGGVPLL